MSRLHAPPRWRGWAGLVVAPVAWALHHQAGSYLNFADCHRGTGAVLAAIGAACLAVTLIAGLLSYAAWHRAGGGEAHDEAPSGRFIPLLSLMTAGLVLLTLMVQIGAAILLPPCFR